MPEREHETCKFSLPFLKNWGEPFTEVLALLDS